MKKIMSIALLSSIMLSALIAKPKLPKAFKGIKVPADYVEMEIPEGEEIVMDDFEDGLYWDKTGWPADFVSGVSLSTDWGSNGKTSLKVTYAEQPGGDKGTVTCTSPLETDWSGAKYVVLDVGNKSNDPIDLVLVLQTGENWTWTQTDPVRCGPGIHSIVFDISSFPSLEIIDQMFICIVNWNEDTSPSGEFYIDNYRVIK